MAPVLALPGSILNILKIQTQCRYKIPPIDVPFWITRRR
jgi:hypothetical protein